MSSLTLNHELIENLSLQINNSLSHNNILSRSNSSSQNLFGYEADVDSIVEEDDYIEESEEYKTSKIVVDDLIPVYQAIARIVILK